MKYKIGNILCLNDGRNVYIFSIDEKTRKYQVANVDNENNPDLFWISENEIFIVST